MSSETIYHYVYQIENIIEHKHYIGARSSKLHPKDDIGIKYFSSSRTKLFKEDQLKNPQNYKYHVLDVFSSREDAVNFEIELHKRYCVGINKLFYNKARQGSVKFDPSGIKHTDETKKKMSNAKRGKVIVKDAEGHSFSVSATDPRYLAGDLIPVVRGRRHSIETRKKISSFREKLPAQQKEETGFDENKKSKFSVETRRKMSEAKKGKPKTEEHKQKMRKPKTHKKPRSPEHNQKIREANLLYWAEQRKIKLAKAGS